MMTLVSTRPLAFSDDPARQAERRRQFHRAIQFHALRLNALPRIMAAGEVRIFGGDAHMAHGRLVLAARLDRLRHRQAAMADVEVYGCVDL